MDTDEYMNIIKLKVLIQAAKLGNFYPSSLDSYFRIEIEADIKIPKLKSVILLDEMKQKNRDKSSENHPENPSENP